MSDSKLRNASWQFLGFSIKVLGSSSAVLSALKAGQLLGERPHLFLAGFVFKGCILCLGLRP